MRLMRAFAVLAMVLAAPVVQADKLLELVDQPVGLKADGAALTAEEVQGAILRACGKRGWTPRIEAPGVIVASILVRQTYYAEVRIPFGPQAYSIMYGASRELDYNAEKRTIERHYNKWVQILSKDITTQLLAVSTGAAAPK